MVRCQPLTQLYRQLLKRALRVTDYVDIYVNIGQYYSKMLVDMCKIQVYRHMPDINEL